MFAELLAIVAVLLSIYFFLLKPGPLSHVPGPRSWPIVGNALQLDLKHVHMSIDELSKKYGPVYRLTFQGKQCLIVCDFASIYEILVTKSADFAGRPSYYLSDVFSEGKSGLMRTDYGPEIHGRRKLFHSYIKLHGAGLKKLEQITMNATRDMIEEFIKHEGQAVDINQRLTQCMFDVLAILCIGEPFAEGFVEEATRIFKPIVEGLSKSLSAEIVNRYPSARHFGNNAYNGVVQAAEIRDTLLSKVFESKPADGLIHYMQELSDEELQKYQVPELKQRMQVAFDVIAAGVFTSSTTLTILMNILCQRPDVQEKLRDEIADVLGSRAPCLTDRENMPYHAATLMEVGRYASILPFSVPHKTTRDTVLTAGGRNIKVPANTEVLTHLWSLHHNAEFWKDPYHFDPGRFLDANGQLVPADHPHRKHLMPFGAGIRGCIGELFAASRMFLVLCSTVQTFNILPESTMEKQPSHDPRHLIQGNLLVPAKFKVRLQMI